jgi:hypothetical protein
MDLGIRGKRALVCASSKGLGRGCAEALAEAGVELVLNARGAEALEATAAEIRAAYDVTVVAVAADITTEAGRAKVLAAAGEIDILVTNAGGPPPGLWSDWSRDDFIKALDANMLTPVALMQALMPGMMARGWGRVVNITSQSVKAPIAQLGLSNAARAGLTGFVAGTAGGGRGRHDQQPVAGYSRDRPRHLAGYRGGKGARYHPGRGACAAGGIDSRASLWHRTGIRCGLRVLMFTARGLHRWAKHSAGRRRDERDAVTPGAFGQPFAG